mmetsp:Transcript_10390/g.21865  ORF Transcript_10390/g.21865 Transcript_10390/m.21865 type:complete len:98 (-) Transcript_10390:2328-2621(-)
MIFTEGIVPGMAKKMGAVKITDLITQTLAKQLCKPVAFAAVRKTMTGCFWTIQYKTKAAVTTYPIGTIQQKTDVTGMLMKILIVMTTGQIFRMATGL